MDNTQNIQIEAQGVEFWEKELQYLENAMEGIRTAYAIMESNHKFCQQKLKEAMPSGKDEE